MGIICAGGNLKHALYFGLDTVLLQHFSDCVFTTGNALRNKPFGLLAKGLVSKVSRGDRARLELFQQGIVQL